MEAWALRFLTSDTWAEKLQPGAPPRAFAEGASPMDHPRPGRGSGFTIASRSDKSTGSSALRSELRRSKLVHTFLHHELCAAELMAWALLRFPDAPEELRRGLLRVLLDEVRHMNLYAAYLRARGHEPGAFPIRDWFWERVPSCPDLPCFLATMGIGFEGANLDHASRFAARFRAVGDEEGALLQERVAREEVPHVRLAVTWFTRLSPLVQAGEPLFDAWRRSLPPPLSPLLMRGDPLAVGLRDRAGLDARFVGSLASYRP